MSFAPAPAAAQPAQVPPAPPLAPGMSFAPAPAEAPPAQVPPAPPLAPGMSFAPPPAAAQPAQVPPAPPLAPGMSFAPAPAEAPPTQVPPAPPLAPGMSFAPPPAAAQPAQVPPAPPLAPGMSFAPAPAAAPPTQVPPAPPLAPGMSFAPAPAAAQPAQVPPAPPLAPGMSFAPAPAAAPPAQVPPAPPLAPGVSFAPPPAAAPPAQVPPAPPLAPGMSFAPAPAEAPPAQVPPAPPLPPGVSFAPPPAAAPPAQVPPAPPLPPGVSFAPLPAAAPPAQVPPAPPLPPGVSFAPAPAAAPPTQVPPAPPLAPGMSFAPPPAAAPPAQVPPAPPLAPGMSFAPPPAAAQPAQVPPAPPLAPGMSFAPAPAEAPPTQVPPAPPLAPGMSFAPAPAAAQPAQVLPASPLAPGMPFAPAPRVAQPVLAVTVPVATAAPATPAALPVKASRKRPADMLIDTDTRLEFDGRMGRAVKLIKLGTGTLVLNHAGEMREGVHLKKGRIELGHAQGLGTGTLFMDDGSTIDLVADGMHIANPLHMTGSDDPEIHTSGNHATWDGAITGAGFLTKQGAGSLTLTSVHNRYTGATEIAQGTLQAGAPNTFSAASAHSIAADAALNLAGFDQSIAGLHNGGVVQFGAAPGAPGTVLTVSGPYVGQGGELAVSANANGSDRMRLSGAAAVASGNTTVRVTNPGDLGAPTTGEDIEVVGTENGARLEPGAFALAGEHVDAGAYEYRLHQTDRSANLKSAYRAEVPLVSALPAQLRQADIAMLGSMHQRQGGEPGGAASDRRAWGRILRTEPRIRQQGTVSPQSSGHLDGFQAGLDLYAASNAQAGVYLGQLKGDMRVQGLASGVAGKHVGFNHLRGRYLGAYANWKGDTGLYADTVVQWGEYRSHLHAQDSHATTKAHSRLASFEVGQPLAIDSRWQIEPQAQLVYRQLSLGDTALTHATVKHKTPSDWTLRLGARIKGSLITSAGALQPYGSVNLYKTSSTSDVARFVAPAITTDIKARGGHTSTALAAGAALQVNPRTGFYGEVSRQWANGGHATVKSGVQAAVGVKLLW
ncbi:autotransporter outer membrane beta-barrel domain-containing protein [Comamonas endophytica]